MAEATGAVQAYIGATPFRPESAQLLDLRAHATYYDSDEWIEYDDGIRLAADRHQLNVIEESRADGLWLDETEPAGAYRVFAASEENIRSWAAEVAGRYNQDAVMVAFTDPDGDDDMLTFGDMDGGISTGLALEAMRRAGVPGDRVMGGSLQIVSTSSDPLTKQQIDMLMDRLGPFDVTPVRAEFIEKDTRFLAHSPIKEIQAIRQAHCERHNLPVRRPVPHLSETDDIAAAKTYDTARHQPLLHDVLSCPIIWPLLFELRGQVMRRRQGPRWRLRWRRGVMVSRLLMVMMRATWLTGAPGVVVEPELVRERVLVRRHFRTELRERAVAVTLGDVAEHFPLARHMVYGEHSGNAFHVNWRVAGHVRQRDQ